MLLRAQKDTAGYFVSFDGAKIYYETRGTGPAVVLLHGFINNGDTWKKTPLYSDLFHKGYRVITMDLRGNGKSDKPHDSTAYANDAEAKDVIGLLKYLGVPSYAAIGYSRGSIITARLLVLDKRVERAILGGMGDGFTDPNWPRRIMFYRALSGEPIKELEGAMKYVKESGADQVALAYQQKYQPATTPDTLALIQQKVLVLIGDNDPDNGSPQSLAKMLRNGILETVPGDHNSTLRSEAFSAAVLRFLSPK